MDIIAAIDLDALLPLIVGVFWVVAQLIGAAAKKKPAPPRRPTGEKIDKEKENPPALSEVEGLADLFRKLGGVQEFKIPEPPESVPRDAVPPPRPQPIQGPTAKTPRLQEKAPPPTLKLEDIQKPDLSPAMESFKTAMPSMKRPAMTLSFQGLEKSSENLPRVERIINPSDRSTLRRAMLSHVILGKPKGMDGWNTGRMD